MSKSNWVWSTDGEDFFSDIFPTREAALEDARDWDASIPIWTGRAVPVDPLDFAPSGYDMVEWMAERAWEELGYSTENWLRAISMDAEQRLHERIHTVIGEWLREEDEEPTFFYVFEVLKHPPTLDVKQEDE